MNFVLAIALGAGVFMVGRKVPAYRLEPAVVQSIAPNSAGQAAGFRKGDRIVSIDGKPMENWQDAEFAFAINAAPEALRHRRPRGEAAHDPARSPRGISKFDIGYTGIGPALRAPGRPRPFAQPGRGGGVPERGCDLSDFRRLGRERSRGLSTPSAAMRPGPRRSSSPARGSRSR